MSHLQLGTAPFFHVPGERAPASGRLVATSGPAAWNRDFCLFRLPEHLRKRWWNLAAGELAEGASASPGFHAFLESFRKFAAYKELPLAPAMRFDVLARPPDEEAADFSATALANLGDEATRVLANGEILTLAPGEALWAPAGASLVAADTRGKTDLDVLFVILAR